MALLLKVRVDKICIYPFGGISKFYLSLNSSQLTELFILVMGPLMQMVGYFILINNLSEYRNLINIYNYGILFFNLLPIYPLDGGKILNIFLSYIFNFKKSLNISIIISYLCVLCLLICFIKFININVCLIIVFLIYKISYEYRRVNYYYHKFLLERFLNKYYFRKRKVINSSDFFYRNCNHLIKENNKYYTEKDFLEKIYKKR